VVSGNGAIEGVHVAIMQALGLNTTRFGRAGGPMSGLLV
jgi:hypothetical protein